jgi:hypothetical protein
LDGHKAYQLRWSIGMRKAIKGASKKDASVFFSFGIWTCKYRHLPEKDLDEGI